MLILIKWYSTERNSKTFVWFFTASLDLDCEYSPNSVVRSQHWNQPTYWKLHLQMQKALSNTLDQVYVTPMVLNYPSLLFSRDLGCRLKLVRVGAVTISLGRLFQSSTTLSVNNRCRNLVRQCCFSSFRVWPRSCLCEYVNVDRFVLYKSCVYLDT